MYGYLRLGFGKLRGDFRYYVVATMDEDYGIGRLCNRLDDMPLSARCR